MKGDESRNNSKDSETQTTVPPAAPGDASKNGTSSPPEYPSTGNETAKADGT